MYIYKMINHNSKKERVIFMLWLALILVCLWFAGMLTAYTLGGLIHILLVIAIIVVLVRIIQGKRPV